MEKHRNCSNRTLPASNFDRAHLTFETAESLFAENHIRQALRYYQRAAHLGLSDSAGASRRWMCHMMLGQFEHAWHETDLTELQRRTSALSQDHLPLHLRRVWNGTPLCGKRVLVRCYHGLGDTIQFIRFTNVLKRVAESVIVQCEPRLIPLLQSRNSIDRFIPLDCSVEPFSYDAEIELMELPYAFRTTLETLPSRCPYIRLSPELSQPETASVRKSDLHSQLLNVGICWASGGWNPARDLHIAQFAPLFRVPGVRLFSLQKGLPAEHLRDSQCKFQLASLESPGNTLCDTAAVISSLDLIISVDTMVAHLAGALGKSVWILLPFHADWRWMIKLEHSPWYPTMRLFRQRRSGDWRFVITRVTQELMRFARERARLGCGCAHSRIPEKGEQR